MDQCKALLKSNLIDVIIVISFILFVSVFLFGYINSWHWVGVVEYSFENNKPKEVLGTKTLWDWADLVLVPLVIGIAGFLFTRSQNRIELELSTDKQWQNTFDAYLEQMANLLLNHNLLDSKEGDHIQSIARAKTLMTFRSLDGTRKGQLLIFLYETGLIKNGNVIISLKGADLRGAQLSKSNFEDICLSKVDLSGANLAESSLRNVDLKFANLSKTNLQKVFLSNSDAYGANFQHSDLSGSHILQTKMQQIDFSKADFRNATLRVTEFNYSNMTRTRWTKAIIVKSTLNYCKLNQAEINDCKILMSDFLVADLTESNFARSEIKSTSLAFANLTNVILDDVNMSNAHWEDVQPHLSKIMLVKSEDYISTVITIEQLLQAKSFEGAIMPNGKGYEIWKREQFALDPEEPSSQAKDR